MFLFNIYNHTIVLLYSFCLKDHAENSIGVTADDVRVSIAASDAHGETNNELLELMRKLVEYTLESSSRAVRVLERLFDYLLRSGSWKRRSPCSASRSWIWRFYSSLVSAFFFIQGLITV